MTDHDPFRLEPSEGQRTGGAAGERLVVGLAAFALVAGLLIALGKLVPHAPEVTGATSPTPSPTPSSSESASVWPPPHLLRELTLESGTPPPAANLAYPFSGFVRATADVTIRAQPKPDAMAFGVMPAGAIAFAEELPDVSPADLGWLHITAGQPQGWVATTAGQTQLVERIQPAPAPVSGDIWTVAAGADGFLALGSASGLSTENLPALVAASTNGNAWEMANLAAVPGYGFVVGWGPVGWLALVTVEGQERPGIWVWRSVDGIAWTPLGKMPGEAEYPSLLAGSEAGYLLVAGEGRGQGTTFWFSEDGVTWRETAAAGLTPTGPLRLAAGPDGFYAWDAQGGLGTVAVYSGDARTWAPVSDGPRGPSSQVISVGAAWIGTDLESGTGARRLWIGQVKVKQLTWRRETDTHVFGDAVVTTMVSDGRRAVAVGWKRSTEQPMAWVRERGGWVPSPLPDAFGGLPRIAAAGPSGVVVVGYRPTVRGQNPVFWHLTRDSSWVPEKDPLLEVATDPPAEECGPAPSTAVDFLVLLDHTLAVACFGGTPITFRAWSVSCPGCFVDSSGNAQPAWLAMPGRNQLALSPLEDFDGWNSSVVLEPPLKLDPAWTGKWLELTGHFNDPASASCRSTPSIDEELYYAGRQSAVDGCRQQFVVTSVRPVEGP